MEGKSRRCLAIFHERGSSEKSWRESWLLPLPAPQFRFSHNLSLTMMPPPTANFPPSRAGGGEISGGRPFSRPSVDIPREKRTASVSVSRILADEETRRSRLSLELTFPPPANNYHHRRRRVRRKFTRRRRRRRRFSSPCNRPSSRKLKRFVRDADSSASVQEFRVQKCGNVCENIVSRKIRSFLLNCRNRRRVFDDVVLYGMDLQFETRVSFLLNFNSRYLCVRMLLYVGLYVEKGDLTIFRFY